MFEHFKKLFDNDQIQALTETPEGLLWLKVKSLSRATFLAKLQQDLGLPAGRTLTENFQNVFDALCRDPARYHPQIDAFIRNHMSVLGPQEENRLVSELYQIKHFDWGGDYKNALDKFLIDRYVKQYSSFDAIHHKLATEIPRAVEGYVVCSWYNHWSTILIENIFKKHPRVLSAIGNVKRVDFFVGNIPFDLKVTYLPTNFIEAQRKKAGLKPEIAELKAAAKQAGIPIESAGRQKDLYHELVERLKDSANTHGHQVIAAIQDFRRQLAYACQHNPRPLIQNLYEEQGEMRFDASNRLFLILVDLHDYDASWKLKRHMELLSKSIMDYLDRFDCTNLDDLQVEFTHKSKNGTFYSLSDAIFVLRD
jgi:hypothetical protein